MTRQSQTEILKQLLPAAAAGTYDEALNDVAVHGPRGGMRGYTRAPGAARLGNTGILTRVMDDDDFAVDVHHGLSFHYGYHPDHPHIRNLCTGPTFPVADMPAVMACVWAARTRDPEVLARLTGGDAQAAVAKAVELHAAVFAQDTDEDQALGM
jgi:hypothetical protein